MNVIHASYPSPTFPTSFPISSFSSLALPSGTPLTSATIPKALDPRPLPSTAPSMALPLNISLPYTSPSDEIATGSRSSSRSSTKKRTAPTTDEDHSLDPRASRHKQTCRRTFVCERHKRVFKIEKDYLRHMYETVAHGAVPTHPAKCGRKFIRRDEVSRHEKKCLGCKAQAFSSASLSSGGDAMEASDAIAPPSSRSGPPSPDAPASVPTSTHRFPSSSFSFNCPPRHYPQTTAHDPLLLQMLHQRNSSMSLPAELPMQPPASYPPPCNLHHTSYPSIHLPYDQQVPPQILADQFQREGSSGLYTAHVPDNSLAHDIGQPSGSSMHPQQVAGTSWSTEPATDPALLYQSPLDAMSGFTNSTAFPDEFQELFRGSGMAPYPLHA